MSTSRPDDVANSVVVPGWPRPVGYSDALSATGRLVVTAGLIGWNPRTQAFDSDDFGTQARQTLDNLVAVLRAAGASPRHLVRLTWFVISREEYLAARPAIGASYRELIGDHYPAMSVIVVAGLLEPRARLEIEATAIVPG